ncbi:MAG: DoxX family protein [Gemmatimonadota bacterium]
MQTQSSHPISPMSKPALWAGRFLSGFGVLFLVFDAVIKLMKIQAVVDSFGQLGIPVSQAAGIGVLLLLCTAVYVIPRTSFLGGVLLTGYLGGAIAVQVRAQAALFPTVFPLIIAALIWGGLLLRDARVRTFLPLRGADA